MDNTNSSIEKAPEKATVYTLGIRGNDGDRATAAKPDLLTVSAEALVGGEPNVVFAEECGLSEEQAREASIRIKSALFRALGGPLSRRVVLRLSRPLGRFESFAPFDLPSALAIFWAHEGEAARSVFSRSACYVGELALGGQVRPIRGALMRARAARPDLAVILSTENLIECDMGVPAHRVGAPAQPVLGVDSFERALAGVYGYDPNPAHARQQQQPQRAHEPLMSEMLPGEDITTILARLGEAQDTRRGFLLLPPPGGRMGRATQLARRIPAALPPLSDKERREVAETYGVAGLGLGRSALATGRPFRAPHHTVSEAGLCGANGRPGEAALAHGGVLFLDEVDEYKPNILQHLASIIGWGKDHAGYPCRCLVVATLSDCSCRRGPLCHCPADKKEARRERVRAALRFLADIEVTIVDPQSPAP